MRVDDDIKLAMEHYLAGQMSPQEEAAFEEQYLHNPELVEDLAMGHQFVEGLRHVAGEKRTRETPPLMGTLFKSGSQASSLMSAVAVIVILAIPIGWLFRDVDTIEERLDQVLAAVNGNGPPINLPIFSLQPVRSAEPTPFRLNLTDLTGWVVLSLETASMYDEYRVNLQSDTGEPIWSHEGLVPDHIGALVFALPASALVNGDYQAVTEGRNSAGAWEPASTFTFSVTRQEP